MKKALKILGEPVFLFIVPGILLFFIYLKTTEVFDQESKSILVSTEQIEILTASFEKTWKRSPDEKELESLIDNYIIDEIFYKEATAMGLDKSDPAIKRRLRQIMEMMLDDLAVVYPSETQLSNYLSENPDKFRQDPVISFRHIYFDPGERKAAIELKEKLIRNEKVNDYEIGGLSLLPAQFENETYSMIERTFGQNFARTIFETHTESWQGPIESAYGWHIVYISKLENGKMPQLDEIWDIVEREWTIENKKEQKEMLYNKMKENYIIRIENNE